MEEFVGLITLKLSDEEEDAFDIRSVKSWEKMFATTFNLTIHEDMVDLKGFEFVRPNTRIKTEGRVLDGENVSKRHCWEQVTKTFLADRIFFYLISECYNSIR